MEVETFKGTKGIWNSYQNVTGDIEISTTEFSNLATVNFYPKGFREQYINGKLSGSSAPNLLHALQNLVKFCKENDVGAELEFAEETILKTLS